MPFSSEKQRCRICVVYSEASLSEMNVDAGGQGVLPRILIVSCPFMLIGSFVPDVQMNSTGRVCIISVLNCFRVKSSSKVPK